MCTSVYYIIIKLCLSSWTRPSVSDSVSSTTFFFYISAFPLSFYTMSYVCIILLILDYVMAIFSVCHHWMMSFYTNNTCRCLYENGVYHGFISGVPCHSILLCIKSLVHHVYYKSWSYVISIYNVLCNPHNIIPLVPHNYKDHEAILLL